MFQFLSDYARSDQGQGHDFMPCFTGRRASSRSYVVCWVSPKWSHSFPGRHRSPLGLAPFVIDTPSVDVMGHARQASSTYARFDRLDIASGGRLTVVEQPIRLKDPKSEREQNPETHYRSA